MGRPLIEDDRRRRMRLRVRRKRGQPTEPLGVDQGKALIYARLRLPKPGPGYLHFPADPAFDEEYFAQLAAEQLVKRLRGSRVFSEWKQLRPRNEALDCLLLALAACRLAGPLPAKPPARLAKVADMVAAASAASDSPLSNANPTTTPQNSLKKIPSSPRRLSQHLGW